MYKVKVFVYYKESILDPQAAVIEGATKRLEVGEVSNIRVGKVFDFTITADSEDAANKQVKTLCEELLANPIMETYDFTLTEAN